MSPRGIEAADLRRAHPLCDPLALAEALGLSEGMRRSGRNAMVRCPVHAEKTPSCSVRVAQDGTVAVRCHGCEWTGDALDLVAVVAGLDKRTAFAAILTRAAELAGVRPGERLAPPSRPDAPPPPPREHAPVDEVSALWSACRPVLDDEGVSGWLRSRRIDPAMVEARDLARALPAGSLPRWSRYQGRTWGSTGHRCVLPTYDATGAMRGVRVRRVTAEGDAPKSLPPAGHSSAGLVLADRTAVSVLRTGARPNWWPASVPLHVLIAEGEPDYLAAATAWSDSDEAAPGILGLPGSGAWTAATAARIPGGARVTIATDPDEAGERYADVIAGHLERRCDVRRAWGIG